MQKNAKDSQHLWAVDWPQSTMSLSSLDKSFHAPESRLMCLWIPRASTTAERRCWLYCAAISHIGSCPWLPESISQSPMPAPSVHNSGEPCESLASSPVHAAEEWRACEKVTLNRTAFATGRAWGCWFNLLHPHLARQPEKRHSIDSEDHLTSHLAFSFPPSFSSRTHA